MLEAGEDGFVLEDLDGAVVAQGRTKHDPTHRRPFLLKAAITWVQLQWYEEESSGGVCVCRAMALLSSLRDIAGNFILY